MKKSINKPIIIFSFIFYIVAIALMIVGTFNDLQITVNLFNPQSLFAQIFEGFGQFVYWAIWGPAITLIFLCRRDLNESLAVINKLIPAIKPVENTEHKAYKFFNILLKAITTLGFFILAMVGWKKLIENVIKNILLMLDKDNLSQPVYFIICTIFTAIIILLCRKIDKEKLRKLEGLALAGVLFGIFLKIVEECKPITNRVRVREMVAYSNGFLNEKGLSEGKYSPLTSAMTANTDFSAYTPWYRIGDDMGIYSRTDSFPSGHTSCACAAFMLYLFASAYDKLKKLAPFALVISFVYIGIVGFTRMIAGAHYLTDVAGAAILGYSLFLIVCKIYNKFTEKGIIG
ncbi:MAG: phosphatase PAP2 family protein [Eubacterium sp.]|nr:phosphatase PAP2 family protein [Eubacterium sp.]MDE6767904.1 phosphatase PAP2 family protein [Eubacterium sp.]